MIACARDCICEKYCSCICLFVCVCDGILMGELGKRLVDRVIIIWAWVVVFVYAWLYVLLVQWLVATITCFVLSSCSPGARLSIDGLSPFPLSLARARLFFPLVQHRCPIVVMSVLLFVHLSVCLSSTNAVVQGCYVERERSARSSWQKDNISAGGQGLGKRTAI